MRIERWYWLILFCVISLGIHVALAYRGPRLSAPVLPGKPSELEVALDPLPVSRVGAPAPSTAPFPLKERTNGTSNRLNGRRLAGLPEPDIAGPRDRMPGLKPGRSAIARQGNDPTKRDRPFGSQAAGSARVAGQMRMRTIDLTAPPLPLKRRIVPAELAGGGSPAPGALLDGNGGLARASAPPEDVLFNGGGAGGTQLPHAPPQIGGGGGRMLPSVENPQAKETTPENKAGAGPGTGGNQGAGKDGGVGFGKGKGVGTQADGKAPLATEKSKPGNGVGAGTGQNIGTQSPGGGTGTGSPLPGTGGTGNGYGQGNGNGIGNGSGNAPEGKARGVPFGGIAGSGKGDPGGGGTGSRGHDGSGALPTTAQGTVHIVYLLDVSYSMSDYDKIGKARVALKQALTELMPYDSFDIIAFDESVHQFSREMKPASFRNRLNAFAYVDALPLGSGTDLSDGLEAAFSIEGVTQIFVLSDGEPNRGISDFTQLLSLLRILNARRIPIHTLALGLGEQFNGVQLLKAIAQQNRGTFRYIDLRD
jgi:hypothetical protein